MRALGRTATGSRPKAAGRSNKVSATSDALFGGATLTQGHDRAPERPLHAASKQSAFESKPASFHARAKSNVDARLCEDPVVRVLLLSGPELARNLGEPEQRV